MINGAIPYSADWSRLSLSISAGVQGFEPQLADPESAVLPLNDTPMYLQETKLLPVCEMYDTLTRMGCQALFFRDSSPKLQPAANVRRFCPAKRGKRSVIASSSTERGRSWVYPQRAPS